MNFFNALDEHWQQHSGISGGSANVYHVTSLKRPTEHRIAYAQPGATRWRLSAPVGQTFVKDVMEEAQRDFRRGHYDLRSLRHMLEVYAKTTVPRRWKEHRFKMEQQKERREMATLPSFGLF